MAGVLLLHDIKEFLFKMKAYNHADWVKVRQKSFLQNPEDRMQWAIGQAMFQMLPEDHTSGTSSRRWGAILKRPD
ncbi:beta-1,4-mannosyl-glycoprotein 4-beta-N-acetylglucosaminyltransferase [Panicum miliaceum]|uniref:Beta-1,4-mannosyl-glycoprotein 4-beta-N-acetylglucosaminyltransferase n=1 Tax=Panicum miliaceum TaxID=4540 RepID=A0A3L6QLW6_PANMI|nr:beta-1,4-mannosyl-glycoprotein 4-beta-N-acetylglucosaminyltransferase [Panicum miliaceum]